MPEIPEGSEYLVAFLHSAGTALATGMGLVCLTWQEIKAWSEATDNFDIVSPRDMKIIFMLSKAYVQESYLATKKDAKPPYIPRIEDEDGELHEDTRAAISNRAVNVFSTIMLGQKGSL